MIAAPAVPEPRTAADSKEETPISAQVTAERLVAAQREPQNWLMVHRDYAATRVSPPSQINRANADKLKLAFAVGIGRR